MVRPERPRRGARRKLLATSFARGRKGREQRGTLRLAPPEKVGIWPGRKSPSRYSGAAESRLALDRIDPLPNGRLQIVQRSIIPSLKIRQRYCSAHRNERPTDWQ